MNVGLYQGASAMAASEARLEAITSNLASARSTAFKRVASAQHGAEARANRSETVRPDSFKVVDWSQGLLERTGVPTDLALMGQGFFAVEGPEGEVYTRDGQFFVDESGQLVTQERFPVAWEGARGNLDPVGDPIKVGEDGSVWQGARNIGRLSIVDFPALDQLELDGNGYWQASPALNRIASTAEVHQGALEGANVSTIDEMVSLIQTQRSFEAGSQVVRLISQTYERLNSFR